MRIGGRLVVSAVAALVGVAAAVPAAQSVADDPARVRYESGRRLLGMANYTEALRDLDEVVRAYPTSPWAGEALVLKAEYFLEVERNLVQARQDLDRIKEYANVAPAAYLLSGRISLATSRARSSIDSAALDFSRAEDFYRTSPYVPESRYRAGEALQLNRQLDEAIARYQDLALAYPASIWTARALVRLAVCLTGQGRWQEAFSALQRVRTDFRGRADASAETDAALNLSSILYRLYIRKPPAQAPFRYSPAPNFVGVRFDDPAALAVSAADTLAVADRNGIVTADRSGERLPIVAAREPRAVAYRRGHESLLVPFRETTQPVFALEKALQAGGSAPVVLKIPDPSNVNRTVERVSALVHTWKREWLVADPGAKSVWLFSDAGEFVRPFLTQGANLSVDRLAVNAYDEVAVLDAGRKVVAIYDRDGEPLRRIEQNGPQHRFDRPVDIAFDALGHLYVLDRGKSEVVVFGPRASSHTDVVTTFVSAAQRDPSAFRRAVALAVDSRGRLHVYDDGLRKVQVYQ